MLFRVAVLCALHVACAAEKDPSPAPITLYSADFAPDLAGVPDRGRDPSVLALRFGEEETCTGTLVAPDILLTSRACVSKPSPECPAPLRDARTLDVWNGEDLEHASVAGHGLRILVPNETCEADLAMVILDREIPGIHTSSFRRYGPHEGERVRAIGFGDDARLLRDHANVRTTSGRLFTVGEHPCIGQGHVALDEDTGEIVGVLAHFSSCEEPPIYVRTDAFLSFVEDALLQSGEAARVQKAAMKDASAPDAWTPKKLSKSEKPTKDFGSACDRGTDCAAGVCVTEKSGRYCSRSCDFTDKCPYGWRCVSVDASRKACIRSAS